MNPPTLSIPQLLGATAITALATAILLAAGTAGAGADAGASATTTPLSR